MKLGSDIEINKHYLVGQAFNYFFQFRDNFLFVVKTKNKPQALFLLMLVFLLLLLPLLQAVSLIFSSFHVWLPVEPGGWRFTIG